MPNEKRLKDMQCPQCKKEFRLTWNDYTNISDKVYAKQAIFMKDCPSGGIYQVEIRCPHCDYIEEL